MEQLTKKNSILYNQEWINKAIEEGITLPNRKKQELSSDRYSRKKMRK